MFCVSLSEFSSSAVASTGRNQLLLVEVTPLQVFFALMTTFVT
jgi:hypothetical protein